MFALVLVLVLVFIAVAWDGEWKNIARRPKAHSEDTWGCPISHLCLYFCTCIYLYSDFCTHMCAHKKFIAALAKPTEAGVFPRRGCPPRSGRCLACGCLAAFWLAGRTLTLSTFGNFRIYIGLKVKLSGGVRKSAQVGVVFRPVLQASAMLCTPRLGGAGRRVRMQVPIIQEVHGFPQLAGGPVRYRPARRRLARSETHNSGA